MSNISPFKDIVSFDDYCSIIGVPAGQSTNQEAINRITRWIRQATDQIDSMISGTNEIGKLYDFYSNLNLENTLDQRKAYKLKKAICSWVECFVISGKFWVNGVPNVNANVSIDITSSSDDAFLENTRKDIIQDLVVLGLYQTTNIKTNDVSNQELSNELEKYYVLSQQEMNNTYLKLEPQKELQGPLNVGANAINNTGNVVGSFANSKPYLQNYEIIDSVIDANKNEIKNVVIESVENANKANFVLDPLDGIYKKINEFGANYFGAFTKDQTINIANKVFQQSGLEWKDNISYLRGQITFTITKQKTKNRETIDLNWYYSKVNDNLNNNPDDDTLSEYWIYVIEKDVPIEAIIENLKPFILQELNTMVPNEVSKQLAQLPEADYIQESALQVIPFSSEQDKLAYEQATGAVLQEFQPPFYNQIQTNNQSIETINQEIQTINQNVSNCLNLNDKQTQSKITSLNFYQKQYSTPTNKDTKLDISNNFDLNKLVSMEFWVLRSANGPWMKIPSYDISLSSVNSIFPLTLETTQNRLEIWRQARTNTQEWTKCWIKIVYNGELTLN